VKFIISSLFLCSIGLMLGVCCGYVMDLVI
jgi:hypothetical protein